MTTTRLATVGDLIAALQNYAPDSPVGWICETLEYMTYTISEVRAATVPAGRHHDDDAPQEVVWLCEGVEVGYLPNSVLDAWDW